MAAPGGPRRPPLLSVWDYDGMVEHGFTDSQLQRLWLALLREPGFLPAALDNGAADANGANATTTTAPSSPSPAVAFTSPTCQRALDALKPPLPKRLRTLLETNPSVAAMSTRATLVKRSARGDAVKLLVRLADGLEVETVVMVYGMMTNDRARGDDEDQDDQEEKEEDSAPPSSVGDTSARRAIAGRRRTASGVRTAVCFSSQYGCRLGCVFCATGRMGVGANLGAGEIVEQAVLARAACAHFGLPPPASAQAMGQGEPVCGGNYNAVVSAVRSLTHPARGFGLARRRVTLSTVGAVPSKIVDLASDLPGVSLALSLHAPDQELRERIVPSAKAAPLGKILAAVDAYTRHTGQRVFVEYVLLAGVNDGAEHASALRELLRGRDVVINAIPWNPVLAAEEVGADGIEAPERFEAPTAKAVAGFHAEVWLGGKGVPCTVRQERGQDIDGACGQLATRVAEERKRKEKGRRRAVMGVAAGAGDAGGGGGGVCGGGGDCGGGSGGGVKGGGGDVEDVVRDGGGQDVAADAPRPLWRRLLASLGG
jgi:adenine C2-methylase RlmN of 23S rRNA A2503 and tRNA A37